MLPTQRLAGLLARVRQADRVKALERKSKAERKRRKRVEGYLSLLAHHDGSVTPGTPGWQERWEQHDGARVLMLAHKDHAGSLYRWGEAMNAFGDYAVRVATLLPHSFGYATDLLFPHVLPASVDALRRLADEADIVHVKDENGFFYGTNGLPDGFLDSLGKPLVFTQYGSYARKLRDDAGYRAFVGRFAARVALTPDLNDEWYDGALIPQPIDVRAYPYAWHDGNTLAHAPSRPRTKGTDHLLQAVEGLPIEFDLIKDVKHQESLARIAAATVFFDQAGRGDVHPLGNLGITGWYGNAAVEAAVHGVPTIAHLSARSFAGARRAGLDLEAACPILNTPVDVEGIRQTIESFFALSSGERKDLSLRTRAWVEEYHAYDVVARRLGDVYQRTRVGSG